MRRTETQEDFFCSVPNNTETTSALEQDCNVGGWKDKTLKKEWLKEFQ